MTHYIELDAHSKTCTAVVTDKSGKNTSEIPIPNFGKTSVVVAAGGPKAPDFGL